MTLTINGGSTGSFPQMGHVAGAVLNSSNSDRAVVDTSLSTSSSHGDHG